MEIIIGKNAGFCYGVKRAVDGAKEELENSTNTIYCLGEIVHNKEVIKDLENKGIEFIENIEKSKGTTIIRAHGVEKDIYEKAKELEINLKDYTCPKVIKIHQIAEEFAKKGFYIMLTGSKKHPENIGTKSYCGDNYYIVENEEELKYAIEDFKKSKIKKLLLISQTTFSVERFSIIQEDLIQLTPEKIELVIKNTICAETKIRQKEVEELAKKVNKMIIIGGKNSSNTKKLFEISKKYCNESICIENYKEIDISKFNQNDKIGIMAGASTPQESIEEVKQFLISNKQLAKADN